MISAREIGDVSTKNSSSRSPTDCVSWIKSSSKSPACTVYPLGQQFSPPAENSLDKALPTLPESSAMVRSKLYLHPNDCFQDHMCCSLSGLIVPGGLHELFQPHKDTFLSLMVSSTSRILVFGQYKNIILAVVLSSCGQKVS